MWTRTDRSIDLQEHTPTMATPTTEAPAADRPASKPRSGDFGMIAVTLLAALGLIFSFVAFATNDDSPSGGGVAAGPLAISLTEFALSPSDMTVGAGGSLLVTNDGSQIHNLRVEGTDLITPDFGSGESETLDVSSLDPGEYTIFCEIAGHAAAGMTGTLTVSSDGGGTVAGAGGHGGEDTDWEGLDNAMLNTMRAFPAETEGTGNQPLEPSVLADGTKRFELTAEIVQWEVEPGKFVEAWTYNGMVPGPWIKVDVGDNIQVHIQNDLPMGTDIHWHGVRTPNDMDGVAPYTQDLIRAGEDFTYEFVAERKAVGMYHAHHHGQMQVPNGMLGLIQIGDVDLPRGKTISGTLIPEDLEIALEYPMILNDAGTIGLSLNGKSFPATAPISVQEDDWILVHYANEGLQIHPMHQHQFPQLIVAKDGIPLDNPYFADTINVAPGERYSVLLQADSVGTWVWHCHILTHVEREEGMFGMVTAMIVS